MDRFVPRDDVMLCGLPLRDDELVCSLTLCNDEMLCGIPHRDDESVYSLLPRDEGESVIASEARQSVRDVHNLQH